MHPNIKLYDVPEISSVQNMVVRSSSIFGQKLALEDLKQTPISRLTYSELLNNILKFGIALRKLGIKPRSHIAGRSKNVIISKRGENVYPEELEDLLLRSPFVLECMVYGEHDPKLGETIAVQILPDAEAFIELSETNNIPITDELMRETLAKEIAKVNKQISSFKQITKFYLREREFDKTTTQKVKRYLVSKVTAE